MPALRPKHVVSFSSQDEKHPADNILKPETYYKWKCANGGEANATIVLQLEKASVISGIDLGNDGSAFIEVLVGRSSWSQSEEFQVLVLASSFMTPAESKANKETNRVRMFGVEHLNKTVAGEKWDQVKVVCTQPYNQSEPYGLSFVKLYTPADQPKEENKAGTIGRFKLKFDDEESPTLSTGSFFQKKMNLPVESPAAPKMSMAALARGSDPSPRTDTIFKTKVEEIKAAKKISISNDRRDEVVTALFKGAGSKPIKEEQQKIESSEVGKKSAESSKRKFGNEDKPKDTSITPHNKKLKDLSSHIESKQPNILKKIPKHTKIKIKKRNVQYGKILQGVVFALSGYQNPERGNIRDLAMTMGAKYEPSWSDRCTHLICAFANTPKFREVAGKGGKIVKKKWIDECDRKNKRLNTKDYRLDGRGDSSFESSGSDNDEHVEDIEEEGKTLNEDKKVSSECDTEDELEKIRKLNEQENLVSENKNSVLNDDNNEAYEVSTDEGEADILTNEEGTSRAFTDVSAKKTYFEGKTFFFYGDFDVKDTRLLQRYITDNSGSMAEYMRDSVDFVVSQQKWDHNFDQALNDNSSLVFVQPKWIFKCHEKQEFVPYQNYEIKPTSP